MHEVFRAMKTLDFVRLVLLYFDVINSVCQIEVGSIFSLPLQSVLKVSRMKILKRFFISQPTVN